ncbi:MAG: hypothetical protein A3F14_02580 [Gammaproteobacteria bacterium RIFCSPHIGHO2_12_FULL_43_28]|nr:MAG: hypothetical protein A3F14_02580 [Gammaproteobacteria bacterium RIFCSPHIGHO2_12_FULL_43_28]
MSTWIKLIFIGFTLSGLSLASGGPLFAAPKPMEGLKIYQRNLPLQDALRRRLAEDITRYRKANNLWDTLRNDFSLPHYENNPAVRAKINWYMHNRDYLYRAASRAAPYIFYITQQIKTRHLPAELALLPIVESAYNPFNDSPAGAAGIWQLMPSTASGLGIKQDGWYDGRRDVIASTRAALDYLDYLQSFFNGNWLYAIAAYNTGEGNVLAAIKRNLRRGDDINFWALPVAQETRDYVPSLLALAVIISHPYRYPVNLPPIHNAPYLAQIDVGQQIKLRYAATLAGISYNKMLQLNPGFNRESTSIAGPYHKLILPIENVEKFTENLARSPLQKKNNVNVLYRIKSGDTLPAIAKKFKTSVVAIRKANGLTNRTLQEGSNLFIPSHQSISAIVNTEVKPTNLQVAAIQTPPQTKVNLKAKSPYQLKPGDTIYMVRATDTVEKIAQHFHVIRDDILAINQLQAGSLKKGIQIIIPTHPSTNQNQTTTTSLGPGDTLYMVRRGDTLEKIANKFHTSAAAIRLANLIDDNSLLEGEKIVIPNHLRG